LCTINLIALIYAGPYKAGFQAAELDNFENNICCNREVNFFLLLPLVGVQISTSANSYSWVIVGNL
jgi:hypothetical protein